MELEEGGVFLEKSVISSVGYEDSIQNTPKKLIMNLNFYKVIEENGQNIILQKMVTITIK